MGLNRYQLGELIEQRREKFDGKEALPIRGVTKEGFSFPKVEDADTSLYNVFYRNDFVFNPARMELNSIALNTEFEKAICSSLYEVFYVKRKDIILPEYLNLFIKRDEFARHCKFLGWGSAREYCRVANISGIWIDVPDIPLQRKYVAVYEAMVRNQNDYETGLEDLKLIIDAQLEQLKQGKERIELGAIVDEVDVRNADGIAKQVQGVNKSKQFMPSVANGEDILKYKLVGKRQFAANLMHIGRDKAVPIALNFSDTPMLVSPAYLVLKVSDKRFEPEFVLMWLSRAETDRLAWFMCDTHIRGGMEKKRLYDITVPLAPSSVQTALTEMFTAYLMRREINEQLKAQIKDICPILIRGALEEASA